MRIYYVILGVVMILSGIMMGCDKKDDGIDQSNLVLDISGLKSLGEDYVYEGWIRVDGTLISTGTFTVDENGGMSRTMFDIDVETLEKASSFLVSIEPVSGSGDEAGKARILAGNFSGSEAALTIHHGNAIGTDLTSAKGKYILSTPTDGNSSSNENSGIWWVDPNNGPGRGLELPELPEGWKYEGWAIIDEVPVSTGKFRSVVAPDESDKYSETTSAGYDFPGEDFLVNAPSGLSFPVNLSGRSVAVTVEPDPDNSPEPFFLKPLSGKVPDPAESHVLYDMTNTIKSSVPTGTAKR